MARWHIHGIDGNASAISDRLIFRGASVESIGRPVDLLIGFQGLTAVAEVKTAKGKLRETQEKFFARFTGLARVLRTEADADELIDYMTEIVKRSRNYSEIITTVK